MLAPSDVQPGAVLWARTRGYWRQVRVIGMGRRLVRVQYYIRATSRASASLKVQDIPASRLRLGRPIGHYGIVDAPAPPPAPAPAAPPHRCLEPGCGLEFAYIPGVTGTDRCLFHARKP